MKTQFSEVSSILTATVPAWTLPALFNNDFSGLTSEEEQTIREFVIKNDIAIGLLDTFDEETFCHTNDMTDKGATCVEIRWIGGTK